MSGLIKVFFGTALSVTKIDCLIQLRDARRLEDW